MTKPLRLLAIFGGTFLIALLAGYVCNLPREENPVYRSAYCSGAQVVWDEDCSQYDPKPVKSGFPLIYTSVAGIDVEPSSNNSFLYRTNYNILALNLLIFIGVFEVFAVLAYRTALRRPKKPLAKK